MPYYLTSSLFAPQEGWPGLKPWPPLPRPQRTFGILEAEGRGPDTKLRSDPASAVTGLADTSSCISQGLRFLICEMQVAKASSGRCGSPESHPEIKSQKP